MKYKISKEFFPFSRFKAPIINGKLLCHVGAWMRPPRSFFRDPDVCVRRDRIQSFDGKENEVFILEPRGLTSPAPCLVYYHGGGFIFGGSFHHYNIAREYAKRTPCKLIFAQYRLAPKHPHPIPSEDCYAALRFTFENAERLHIDENRIAVAGDSAGGALAAAVCQMARDRATAMPLFQLLIYPVTDRRMHYDSCRRFTDTPMWNARLSVKMWQGYVPNEKAPLMAYASPMEAARFDALPTAYVETAEFDCLHDEGIA
jgi:acetyl esterase/lipase